MTIKDKFNEHLLMVIILMEPVYRAYIARQQVN